MKISQKLLQSRGIMLQRRSLVKAVFKKKLEIQKDDVF